MSFRFQRLEIPDIVLITPRALEDDRGCFLEMYKRSEFEAHGVPDTFVQDNYSISGRGVLRGLHYQTLPKAQGKLVMVLGGEIYDVAVDIREGSPWCCKWIATRLSVQGRSMLYIPVGFAHGFCVLSDEAQVLYKATEEYAPECERGVRWNDPSLGIPWPVERPLISGKDARLPPLPQANYDFKYEGGAS